MGGKTVTADDDRGRWTDGGVVAPPCRRMKRLPAVVAIGLTLAALGPSPASGETPPIMFGGQLVRGTTLDGVVAMDVGGGGALYVPGVPLYWGGGGGHVFQVGDGAGRPAVDLFHGELLLGYDLLRSRRAVVSAMGLAGIGMTKDESGVFGIAEGRLALRRPLARWFMLGGHVAYRRAFRSELARVDDAGLSGPTLGLELYFTH